MHYARLGPSSVLVRVLITELCLPCRGFTPPFRGQGLPSWVYPVEVSHHLLGAKAEQHVLASRSISKQHQQQAHKKSLRPHRG